MRLILPVGTSVWAIVAGYLGLFSVLILPAPFALLFGMLAWRDIKKNQHRNLGGKGRAIFAMVIGGLFTMLGAVALVFALLAD
ncbi:MAG: DUF4190 domain-containing protein [Pirellulaceae bacterium]